MIVNLATNPGATVKYVDGGTGPGFATPDDDYRPEDLSPLFGAPPSVPYRRPDGQPRVQAVLKAWIPSIEERSGNSKLPKATSFWTAAHSPPEVTWILPAARMAGSLPMPPTPAPC